MNVFCVFNVVPLCILLMQLSYCQESIIKCPHELKQAPYGYVLPLSEKPCISLIEAKNLNQKTDDSFAWAMNACRTSLPGGQPFALDYNDLDAIYLKNGRFKDGLQWKPDKLKSFKILLGWKVVEFERPVKLTIEFGNGMKRIYRRTHPEIDYYVKKKEYKAFLRRYKRYKDKLPFCGMYDVTKGVIEILRCKLEQGVQLFNSILCESDAYQKCIREEVESKCVRTSLKCCRRIKYHILQRATVPNERCDAIEEKCDVSCDGANPVNTDWILQSEKFHSNPDEVCGNITQRRFYVPREQINIDCEEHECCVEETVKKTGSCPCIKIKCENGGYCVDIDSSKWRCVCNPKFTGKRCEELVYVEIKEDLKIEKEESFIEYCWLIMVISFSSAAVVTFPIFAYLGYRKGEYDAMAEIIEGRSVTNTGPDLISASLSEDTSSKSSIMITFSN